MTSARVAELLAPFLAAPAARAPADPRHSNQAGEEPALLSPSQLQDISTYIDLLLRWNARINLTAIREPEEIVTRHFGESLFAARHLFAVGTLTDGTARPTVADLGSGAGFPGIPIKLWAPGISLTLIESNHKKAAFLREVARALTLKDVDVQTVRAEELEATFDVVTLRAVERFDSAVAVAARLVAPAGRLALLVGAAQLSQVRSALPRLMWCDPLPIPISKNRVVAIGRV
jgi:16S rRNA (guanine527-N7)-methyltransferase